MLFNTKTGKMVKLDSAEGKATGFTEDDFDTRGPIERFEDFKFMGSDASLPLNCSNSIFNKKPCFPEIVWDNLSPLLLLSITYC